MESNKSKDQGRQHFLSNFLLGGIASFIPEAIGLMLKEGAVRLHPESWKSYFFQYPRHVKQYVFSQGLTFAFYDYARLKLVDQNPSYPSFTYFVYGGMAGLLTSIICHPIGYHQILLVNDIIESDRMKKQGASKAKISSFRMQRMYQGFLRTGINALIYRSIYFGLYDCLKQQTSSLRQKCLFAAISAQMANIMALTISLKKYKTIKNVSNLIDWKNGYLRSLVSSVLTIRGFSNSTSFLIYVAIKQFLISKEIRANLI